MRLGSAVNAVLSAIVVVTSGTRVLFGSPDAWVQFSQIRYGIEREIALYLNACAPYDSAPVSRSLSLVSRISTPQAWNGGLPDVLRPFHASNPVSLSRRR